MEHTLLLDYRDGFFIATCSCGGWSMNAATYGPERPTLVYARIEKEHRRHAHPEKEADEEKAGN